jgi:hypothetical protein
VDRVGLSARGYVGDSRDKHLAVVLRNGHSSGHRRARVGRERDGFRSVRIVLDDELERRANLSARNSGNQVSGGRNEIGAPSARRVPQDQPTKQVASTEGDSASRSDLSRGGQAEECLAYP